MDPAGVAPYGGLLVSTAEQSIRHVFEHGVAWEPSLDGLPVAVRTPAACFVTLECAEQLLGCIGTLAPRGPLAREVARQARAAAFADPRFPPIGPCDFTAMTITVSVLSPVEVLPVRTPIELACVLRPRVDGVVLDAGAHRATLLPSVWRHLKTTDEFLSALWRKAGLRPGAWPLGLRLSRYTAAELRGDPPRAPIARRLAASAPA
jgi:uncharacterized protein